MPELAEVETVRNVLKKQILHKKIVDIKVLYKTMIENTLDEFNKLINEEFIDIKRRGKWLIFETNNYYLLSHLRMEGKYFLKNNSDEIAKHEHVIFYFDDNTTLRYHDVRKFGRMKLIKKEDIVNSVELNKQGYEPGDNKLTGDYLLDKFKGKKLPIKTTLLDQSIISGLGNIYVDEVLFASHINPLREACSIKKKEADNICSSASKIINEAIKHGGTTIRSYTSSLGVTGHYQDYLCVHKRENMPCSICKTSIKRIKINGRSTYYCPKCQK